MSALFTVADVAERFKLKPQSNGKWSGPHPIDKGQASKDGFTLCPEGNAFTNRGEKYTSRQVAEMAGIDPGQYAPFAEWKARSGHANGAAPSQNRARPAPKTSAPKPKATPGKAEGVAPFDWKAAQKFDYHDELGELLFQVGRLDFADGSKAIRQRRPNPNAPGTWLYSLTGTRRVLWQLPDVLAAQIVFICEGEKAAGALILALESAGLFGSHVATTNAQGAGKWRDEFCESLDGKTVCVLPDFDEPGDDHGAAVCASIHASGRAASLCRLDLPDLLPKGDVADWLESGGTIARLLELLERAPQWEPLEAPEAEAEPTKAPRFEEFTFADLAALPRPNWLIRGLLVEETTSVLSADSGSFKSFLALEMALCVATGRAFHGREVKTGNVVYVAAEGFYTMFERATAWARRHGLQLPGNFRILRAPVNVSDPLAVADFVEQFAKISPGFVVLDTLSVNAQGLLNENSNDEMARFMAGMARVGRELGASVQVVHHNGRESGAYRGASAIKANADTHISLERPESDAQNTVFIRCEKQRGKPFEPFALRGIEVVLPFVDEFGDEITSLVFELAEGVAASAKRRDPKAERKAETHAQILAVLDELHAEAHGVKVEKSSWQKAVLERGICKTSYFYEATKELETAGKWVWCSGDCRRESGFSGDSGDSVLSKTESPENAESGFSGDSGDSAPYGRAESPENGKTEKPNFPHSSDSSENQRPEKTTKRAALELEIGEI